MRSIHGASVLNFAAKLLPQVVGLSASAILAVDYVRAAPVFCSEGGGCDAIRRTVFASFFGIPTPFFGLTGFLAIGVAALWPGRTARAAQLWLSVIAALAGAALFAIQVRLGHFCPYCVAADASGMASLIGATVAWSWRESEPPPSLLLPIASGVALALAGAVPLLIGMRRVVPLTVPAVIRREIAETTAGRVAVVDFVDFECPFCRMTNAVLEPLLLARKDRIRLVRRQVPLRMHSHARDAARAACCGEAQGQGDAMASALFRTDVNQLTPEGCEQVAERLGLSLSAYRACIADPRTDQRIDADRQEFKDAGGSALPTLWIGEEVVVGAQPASSLAAALDRALARVGG